VEAMRAALQLAQMLVIIAALVAIVGGLLYALSWALISLVQFFPAIGKRHRHANWDELKKESARGQTAGSGADSQPGTSLKR
jgi:hypothetical protein